MTSDLKTVNIGKNGVTPELVEELNTLLSKYKTVRVKLLKSARLKQSRKDITEDVSLKTKSRLVDLRGNVFILSKK